MVKIKQRIVPKRLRSRVTFNGVNQRRTLTVHQTGNTSKGANAEMHARLQERGNSRQASWHIQSDDTEIIQSFPFTAQTWHASDGRGNGNLHSISWEICINRDGDYLKSLKVAAKGIAKVLKDEGLTVNDLRQHYDWSRKNCPAQIRAGKDGVNWVKFKGMVQAEMSGKSVKPASQPKPVTKTKPQTTNKLAVDGYWGPATTRALQRHYGTTVDGKITGQPNNRSIRNIPSATTSSTGSLLVRAMQRDVGTIVDGKISAPSLMIRALQKRLGTPQDGIVSKPSLMVKEMQRRLNNGTF